MPREESITRTTPADAEVRASPGATGQLACMVTVALLALCPAPGAAPSELRAQDTAAVRPKIDVSKIELQRKGCVPLEVTVGKGSKSDFRTVRAALADATRRDACAVRVRLRPGEHEGSVSIDRDTEILGPRRGRATLVGTVSNTGPHRLAIRSLHLRDADRPGAVSVNHRRARTEIDYVTIMGAHGFGIRQRGGELRLDRVNVLKTIADPRFAGSGAAIVLEDGARAELDGVTLTGNEAQGLVVRNRGTVARASNLRVTDTEYRSGSPLSGTDVGVRPDRGRLKIRERSGVPAVPRSGSSDYDGFGAIEVASGATLLARDLDLFRNEFVGINVHDGGRAHIRSSVVRNTSMVNDRGGMNVAVISGTVELHGLTLAAAELAGLLLAEDASVYMKNSTVRGSPIGVALHFDHPLECLQPGNRFIDNEINLDSSSPSIPDDIRPGEGVRHARCARVPWH